jgi:hypothetical protein
MKVVDVSYLIIEYLWPTYKKTNLMVDYKKKKEKE